MMRHFPYERRKRSMTHLANPSPNLCNLIALIFKTALLIGKLDKLGSSALMAQLLMASLILVQMTRDGQTNRIDFFLMIFNSSDSTFLYHNLREKVNDFYT